jgi:Phage tail tube protein
MTVSADSLRLAIVREATPGVTPANAAFQLLRATSESLAYQPQTQLSNELNPARQVTDVIVTGGQSGGDIAFENSSNPGLELLLESCLAGVWTANTLTVGATLYTHTIEKRWTLDADNADASLQYELHRVVRSIVDSMVLTFPTEGPTTGAATILGGAYARDELELAGSTYVPAGKLPVIVGANISPIEFVIDGQTYVGWCVSTMTVTFRNNGRAIACLGQEGANEVVLGRFEAEVTADVYFHAEARAIMNAFLDRTEIAFSFDALDSLGNGYRFSFTRVRISNATQPTPGTNQDVVVSMTMQALVDVVGVAPNEIETCVTIERVHVSSPWPGV